MEAIFVSRQQAVDNREQLNKRGKSYPSFFGDPLRRKRRGLRYGTLQPPINL